MEYYKPEGPISFDLYAYVRIARCLEQHNSCVANSINNAERKYYHANKVYNYYNYLIASLRYFSKIFLRQKFTVRFSWWVNICVVGVVDRLTITSCYHAETQSHPGDP